MQDVNPLLLQQFADTAALLMLTKSLPEGLL